MPYRLEITSRSDIPDPEGQGIRRKAKDYFGIDIADVRIIQVVTIDADLTPDQLTMLQRDLFTNPVTQVSSFDPLPTPFDFTLWVGYRPGVKDNPGGTAREALEDVLKIRLAPGEAIYTSR